MMGQRGLFVTLRTASLLLCVCRCHAALLKIERSRTIPTTGPIKEIDFTKESRKCLLVDISFCLYSGCCIQIACMLASTKLDARSETLPHKVIRGRGSITAVPRGRSYPLNQPHLR